MTGQDFTKGVDFTGLNPATAANHNNLVEQAVPFDDGGGEGKGLVIRTIDIGPIPNVPDPAAQGKWKRYLWERILNTQTQPIVYAWNDAAPNDATLKHWVNIGTDLTIVDNKAMVALANAANAVALATASINTANAANTAAANAVNTANAANNTANTASGNATTALDNAATAQETADSALTAATAAQATANGKRNVSDGLNPSTTGLQKLRTNFGKTLVEWYNTYDDYALIIEQQNTGVNAANGAMTAGGAIFRKFTTIVANMNPAVALAGAGNDLISFAQTGKYKIRARAPVSYNGQVTHQLCLVRNSTGAIVAYGESKMMNTSVNPYNDYAEVVGVFDVNTAGESLRLDHYCNTAAANAGVAISLAGKEVYTQVEIWRIG